MTEWLRQGSRVYKQGEHSYNLNNKHDATKLCETLNTCETTRTLNRNIEEQYDRITKQIIQLKLNIETLTEEINTLHEAITCLKSQ